MRRDLNATRHAHMTICDSTFELKRFRSNSLQPSLVPFADLSASCSATWAAVPLELVAAVEDALLLILGMCAHGQTSTLHAVVVL